MSDQPLPSALGAAWGLPASEARPGPKPRLRVQTIVETAIETADTDGQAPSLSRVARALGVTTNALYRYVGSRAELDMLVAEAVLGPPPRLGDAPWRGAVRGWAQAMRDRHAQHPWLVEIQAYVPMLPNTLGWLDALLGALVDGGLDLAQAMRAASIIDGYVRAVATRQQAPARATASEQALWYTPEITAEVSRLSREAGLTHVADVLDGSVFESSALTGEDDFLGGLDVILDGLEARRT
ncbi:TetR/AcrR family transcriptional regulator [Actinomycetota bacterium]